MRRGSARGALAERAPLPLHRSVAEDGEGGIIQESVKQIENCLRKEPPGLPAPECRCDRVRLVRVEGRGVSD